MAEKTVFVTVGTTQFDQLINAVTAIETQNILLEKGFSRIIIQMGRGKVHDFKIQKGMNIICYDYKNSLEPDIRDADLVISHAGAGSCLEVLEAGKPLMVVINQNLMDNHQAELANALQSRGYAFACNPETLLDSLRKLDHHKLNPYEKGNAEIFIDFLDHVLGFNPSSS